MVAACLLWLLPARSTFQLAGLSVYQDSYFPYPELFFVSKGSNVSAAGTPTPHSPKVPSLRVYKGAGVPNDKFVLASSRRHSFPDMPPILPIVDLSLPKPHGQMNVGYYLSVELQWLHT
jgi:hypothetical protein